eukprot:tig00000523_g1870.t1
MIGVLAADSISGVTVACTSTTASTGAAAPPSGSLSGISGNPTSISVLVTLAPGAYNCEVTTSNAGGSSLKATRSFTTAAGPALPRISVPAEGAVDVERSSDGKVSLVVTVLSVDAITSATVACAATASLAAVPPVTVSGLSSPTSITVQVPLEPLTGYQCSITTMNAGGSSGAASRTFVTRKGLAPVIASRTLASGPALCEFQAVGSATSLSVQAYDAEGSLVSGRSAGVLSAQLVSLAATDPVDASFSYYGSPPASDSSSAPTITNFQNGTFLVQFQVPPRRGTYELQLSLSTGDAANSGKISNSPIRLFALPAVQSTASFEGIPASISALKGFPISFFAVYRDGNGNFMGNVPASAITSACPAAAAFRASAGAASAPPAAASISLSDAARFDVASTAGAYGPEGTWVDRYTLTGKTSVDGSATIAVSGAVGGSSSVVTSITLAAGDLAVSKSGVASGVCKVYTAGRAFTLVIELRDAKGARVSAFSNVKVTPTYRGPTSTQPASSDAAFVLGDNFRAALNPNIHPSAATATVTMNADGTYAVSVTAFRAGYYEISVSINDQPAGIGSSITVFVNPGEPATAPDSAFANFAASGLEWLSASETRAGLLITGYVAVRDAFGNLVEPAAYQSVDSAERAGTTTLGFGISTGATCPVTSMASPWAASTLSLAAPASIVQILPVVATPSVDGAAKNWNVSYQTFTLAGVYQVGFSVCSVGRQQIHALRSGNTFGAAFSLSVKPNTLSGVQASAALKEDIAGPMAAEADNSIRVTGIDACGNVVDFDQSPNSGFQFAFTDGYAKLPFFADFTTAAGATPLCSYVRYQGVIGCFRDLKIARVPGTTGVVTISYKLYATGAGTLNLFVNTKQVTFIEGSRISSTDAPVARLPVSRTPKAPIQIVSAKFSDAGNIILFTLSEDSDMLQSYKGSAAASLDSAKNVRASAVFQDAATLFGPASFCSFVSPSVLEVTIAGVNDQNAAALAGPSTAASIANSGASILNAIGNSAPIPATASPVIIQAPTNPPAPVVQLSGDTSVGRCDIAEYIAKIDGGGCGRPLTLQWTVRRGGSDVAASSYIVSSTTLRLLASAATGTYQIGLVGKNFLGVSSSQQTVTLSKVDTEIPSVVIAEGAKLETQKTVDLTLSARAAFSACSSSSTVQMEFRWFIDDVEQNGATSSSFTVGPTGKALLQPRAAPYVVRVEGRVKSDPALKNSFATQLTIKAAKLVAEARVFSESGGVRTLTSTIGVDSEVVLDATKSFDPDNVDLATGISGFDPSLACKWTVGAGSPAHSLPKDSSGALAEGAGVTIVAGKNGCVLRISSGSLQPDAASPQKPFSFSVQVTRNDGLNRAAAATSVSVVIVKYSPPAVSISIEGSRVVNSFRELKLTGAVEAPKDVDADDFKSNGESAYKLRYLWTVQSAATLDLASKEVTETDTASSLVLKKNVLRPGQSYTFALAVTMEKDGKTRFASVEITLDVNKPPASGSCKLLEALQDGSLQDVLLTSKKVVALTKEYRLSCSDWVTSSPPLQYAFEVEETANNERTTLRAYTMDSTLPKIKAYPVKSMMKFRGYIRDSTGAFTAYDDLAAVAVEDPTAGMSAADAAAVITRNTEEATSKCMRAQDYVCAFGSVITATSSAQQSAAVNARRRKALETFKSVAPRRRLAAADPALLQIQVDALRSSMKAVEGADYSKATVSAAASQYAVVLGAAFVADYSASIVKDALSLAANLTSRYVRDCNSYTPDTDAVVQNLVEGTLNVFSNDAGIDRTASASLELRQLLSQLGRRSLECGTCASTGGNWTSPVAAYASPSASRKDAELLPIQLCVSRTINYPPQKIAFSGFDPRVGLPSSFAHSVLGDATSDLALDVVALRLPAALYGSSERFASDVVQLAAYRAGCGARCDSLPAANLSDAVSFAGLVPSSATFDFLSERISLARFNASAGTWAETAAGSAAVRGVDGRYTSAATALVPAAEAAAVFHDFAHVIRSRPESRNVTSRSSLGVAFPLYPASGNASAAAVFTASPRSDPAGLVAALAARIRARAAAIGPAAAQIAAFDQALQLDVEAGALSPSATGALEGVQITFSFFGVANPASGKNPPSAAALRDFVYADSLMNGLDMSSVDPYLVGGIPQTLNGQRITWPGVPGIGGFRDVSGKPVAVSIVFPQQAVTLAAFQALYPVSASAYGNLRLVRAVLGALRSAVGNTSFATDLAKTIEIQMAYVGSATGSIVLNVNLFGALLAGPASDGGGSFTVAPTAKGPEPIIQALVYASLSGGLTLPLSDGAALSGGTVRTVGGNFAGLAPYVAAVKAELSRSAAPVPANASRLNFTIRVDNNAGSFAAWLSANYDSLDAATRDDYWLLLVYNFLRRLDPSVGVAGVQLAGRSSFAEAVGSVNGTRRHALQLAATPSVDIAASYSGPSSVLGTGLGFSRNSTFCGATYSLAIPSGTASAKAQCTRNAVSSINGDREPIATASGAASPSQSGGQERPAGGSSGLDGGQIAGISVGVVGGVALVIFVMGYVARNQSRTRAADRDRRARWNAEPLARSGQLQPTVHQLRTGPVHPGASPAGLPMATDVYL